MDAWAGLQFPLSASVTPRYALGIPLPNPKFRDYSSAEFSGTVVGPDGKTWNQARFRSWYYNGAIPNHGYGVTGRWNPAGFLSASHLYMATAGNSTTVDLDDHVFLSQTLHSEMLPFSALYPSHYLKAITLAATISGTAALTPGTDVRAALACYSSAFAYLGMVEFNLASTWTALGGTQQWRRQVAHTAAAMDSNTAYVQLHIGLKSPSGTSHVGIAELSLMLNATDGLQYDDVGVVYFVDVAPVRMAALPSLGMQSPGVRDGRSMVGAMQRMNVSPEGFKLRCTTSWYRENPTTTQKLLTAWQASQEGLGASIPGPVPICIDFGLGGLLPFFGYWHASGSSLDTPFNANWGIGSAGGYDMSLAWEEV